jgi:hypothetical protein
MNLFPLLNRKKTFNEIISNTMKKILTGFVILMSALSFAQAPSKTSFAKSLGLYIFPAKDQDQATQDKDDTDCYKWAVDQSGVDPLNPPKVEAAQVDTSPDGTAVKGAARGAAAGVAIGAIAGDAGKGAAIGAVAGGLAGRRAKVQGDAQQQAANNQAAEQQKAAYTAEFKKAYSVCMEGKGYTVK